MIAALAKGTNPQWFRVFGQALSGIGKSTVSKLCITIKSTLFYKRV
jgi:hypothetical protein